MKLFIYFEVYTLIIMKRFSWWNHLVSNHVSFTMVVMWVARKPVFAKGTFAFWTTRNTKLKTLAVVLLTARSFAFATVSMCRFILVAHLVITNLDNNLRLKGPRIFDHDLLPRLNYLSVLVMLLLVATFKTSTVFAARNPAGKTFTVQLLAFGHLACALAHSYLVNLISLLLTRGPCCLVVVYDL
jgi:hypothetical protein